MYHQPKKGIKWSEICQFWLISWIYCSCLYILTLSVVSVLKIIIMHLVAHQPKARFTCCSASLFDFNMNWCVHLYVHCTCPLYCLFVSDMWHIIFFNEDSFTCNVLWWRSLVLYMQCTKIFERTFWISPFYEVLYVSYAKRRTDIYGYVCVVFMKENRFWLFLIIIIIVIRTPSVRKKIVEWSIIQCYIVCLADDATDEWCS